jgi:hypothetical protein
VTRSYGKVYQRIWADPAWRALDVDAQHLYVLLISQPSLNLAGVLPIQLRRWAACVNGWKPDQVEEALSRLADTGFVVMDWETEECLVRSFIRNDEAFKIPGALKALLEGAQATQSPDLRRSLCNELGRLPSLDGKTAKVGEALIVAARQVLAGGGGDPGPGTGLPVEEPIPEPIPEPTGKLIPEGTAEPIPDPIGDGTAEPIEEPIGEPMPEPSVSVSGSVPKSSSVSSTSVLPVDTGTAATRKGRPTTATGDELFDRFWAAYPRKDAKRKAEQAWRSAIKREKPDVILAGLARFRFEPDPKWIPYPASWLSQDRWADEPPVPGARHLSVIAGGPTAEPSLSKAQIDEILGPDYWQPPAPPQHISDDSPAYPAWAREQREQHMAERVRQAISKLNGHATGSRAR